LALAPLVAGLVLLGCEASDPLVAIRQQQASGDVVGTIEPLRELLAEAPDDPELNFLYGQALANSENPALASWSLRKAMKDPAWLVPAAMQLAYSALGARDYNEVVEITSTILEREPENVSALLMRAQAYVYWKKDPEKALADAKRVLELDQQGLDGFKPMILALIDLDRHDEAREALAEAGSRLAAEPRPAQIMAWYCVTTAVFAQEAGDVEEARATFARCLDEHPADRDAVQSAVAFHDAIGEPDQSLEILRTALAAAPRSQALRAGLAERLRVQGDIVEAEALLLEGVKDENPGAAAAWMDLGRLRQAAGDHPAAADAMQRAVELARASGASTPQLEFAYADALVLAGRLDEALEVAEGIGVSAQRGMIRARVAQSRHEPARALEEFDEALRLWPDNPWARYHAALAAEELGDFDRAIEEYRYSIRISPGATDARTRAAALLLAEGKALLAIQLLAVKAGEEPLALEGQLLALKLAGLLGDIQRVQRSLKRLEKTHPAWVGLGWSRAAEGAAKRAGAGAALEQLEAAVALDLTDLRLLAALRTFVSLSHEAGNPAAADDAVKAALDAHPRSSALHEIRGLHLELSGAAREEARAAYERALELEPRNARASTGLGRLALGDDPQAALAWFDRAAAADPADAEPELGAARALAASGELDRAAERLDALLVEHPLDAQAAAERARLDLDRGIATPGTLERARRAVRFGGGPDALELLRQARAVHGEPEKAVPAGERAREPRGDAPSNG
jgi:tetratricopeptide (TPR) repeat protein